MTGHDVKVKLTCTRLSVVEQRETLMTSARVEVGSLSVVDTLVITSAIVHRATTA